MPYRLSMDLGCYIAPVFECGIYLRGVRSLLVSDGMGIFRCSSSLSNLHRYASGATIQVLLFAVLAVEIKRK